MGRRRSRPSKGTGKEGAKRGAWSGEEDEILVNYIRAHGEGRWERIPRRTGLRRCGRSCRLRWLNYLRPDIKRGNISLEEEDLILRLHKLLGNRWSLIAGRLPGRTDNEIKNYWNVTLRKKLQRQASSSPTTTSPNMPSRSLHDERAPPSTAEDAAYDAHRRFPAGAHHEVVQIAAATAVTADGDDADGRARAIGCAVVDVANTHLRRRPPDSTAAAGRDDDGDDDQDRDGWLEALRLCDGDLQQEIDDRYTMVSLQRSLIIHEGTFGTAGD